MTSSEKEIDLRREPEVEADFEALGTFSKSNTHSSTGGGADTTLPELKQYPDTPLEAALELAKEGWKVFPLRGKRQPLVKRGVYAASDDPEEIRSMFTSVAGREATGVGGSCADRVVVDIDPRNGGKVPEDLPPTRVHYSGRGDGGCHLIYDLPPGVQGLKSSTSKISPGVDIKTGKGSYVVLPGSIHPDTGNKYTANSVDIAVVPTDLLKRLQSGNKQGDDSPRGQSLKSLLDNPPEVGGRNEWLTSVAGYYANQFYGKTDGGNLYDQAVGDANDLLRDPLDSDEVDKTADSIWQSECDQRFADDLEADQLRSELDESNGWIKSGGDHLMTMKWEGSGKNAKAVPHCLAHFDLRVVSRIWDPQDETWVYECDAHSQHKPGKPDRILLRANDMGNPRTARPLLAARELTVLSTSALVSGQDCWTMLLSYLRSQPAPERTLVRNLGWNEREGAYVTHEGAIDAGGHRPLTQATPDASLRWVGDSYGFAGSAKEAKEVLAEVLHFQEPEVTAVHGAWWAASLAKQWIKPSLALFPVCAVEAASGSGKTTGYFSFMSELGGSTTGEGHYTPAVLRNRLAANTNGITWVDDMEKPETVHEMIRVLTATGQLSKMDQNNNPVHFELVGSLLFSGEALDFGSQKSLRDRVIMVRPAPPHGRKSRHDPQRTQWEDVVSLRERLQDHGGGHQLAGHFLQAVAGMENEIREWVREEIRNNNGGGRQQSAATTLLVGARILERLSGVRSLADDSGFTRSLYDWVVETVQKPASMTPEEKLEASEGGAAFEYDNTVTTKLIPQYLQDQGHLHVANAAGWDAATGTLWVHPPSLVKWVESSTRSPNVRTESKTSIQAQLRQLKNAVPDQAESTTKRIGNPATTKRVWVLSGELARITYQRSAVWY